MKKIVIVLLIACFLLTATVFAAVPVVTVDCQEKFVFFAVSPEQIVDEFKLAALNCVQTEETVKEWLLSAQAARVLPFDSKKAGAGGKTGSYNAFVLMTSERQTEEVSRTLGVVRLSLYFTYDFLLCKTDDKTGRLVLLYCQPVNVVAKDIMQKPADGSRDDAGVAEIFQKVLKQSFGQQLEPQLKKLDWTKVLAGAGSSNIFQIEKVSMSSAKVRALYGNRSELAGRAVAEWYTGWLAAAGFTVYPALCNNVITADEKTSSYSLIMNDFGDARTVFLNKAANLLRLDISGVNCKESDVNFAGRKLTYKVWLTTEWLNRYRHEQEFVAEKYITNGTAEYDERDQYTQCLLEDCKLSVEDLLRFTKSSR